jgi:hypothetical protein
LPQRPQWSRRALVSTQAPLQKLSPAAHTQAPAWQVLPPVHARPQPPQFVALVRRSTQAAPHAV